MAEPAARKRKDDWRITAQLHSLGNKTLKLGMERDVCETDDTEQPLRIRALRAFSRPVRDLPPCKLQVLSNLTLTLPNLRIREIAYRLLDRGIEPQPTQCYSGNICHNLSPAH